MFFMCIHFVSSLLLAAVGGVLCALSPLSVVAMSFLDWQTRLSHGNPDAVVHFVRIGVAAERARTGAEFAARLALLEGGMDEQVVTEHDWDLELFGDNDDEEPPLPADSVAARSAAAAAPTTQTTPTPDQHGNERLGPRPKQMPALHVFYYGKLFHICGF